VCFSAEILSLQGEGKARVSSHLQHDLDVVGTHAHNRRASLHLS